MRLKLVTAALGVAVAGLAAVVVVDHTAATHTQPVAAAPIAATNVSAQQQAFGTLAATSGGPMKLLSELSRLTGVPAGTILSDLKAGESLNQIAGSKAGAVRSAVLAEVTKELNTAVTKGAITAGDETRLLNDANDAVSVLMGAKLGLLAPAR